MKKHTLALVAVLFTIQSAQATIRTLCNMPYTPGQFTTFAAAILAAAPNDTIYVHGSSINYGSVTITKAITLIGAGHNPNKQAPLPSLFASILINGGVSNCQFIGLTIQGLNLSNANNNVTVKRCKFMEFSGTPPSIGITATNESGLIVEGCVFLPPVLSPISANISFVGTACSNTIIRNNIFSRDVIGNSVATLPGTFFIENNLFLGTINAFNGINQAIINNNIFYRSSPQGAFGGVNNNVMNNNISFNCAINTFSAPGVNNLVNVNPLFTTFPLAGATFDYAHNYILAAGSPGLINGTDGTDRGVFGGFGFRFNMTGEPAMAEIFSFQITSATTILPGGTLDISVTSKRVR